MKLNLPRGFNKMTREEQGKVIAANLSKAKELYDYWSRQSRQFVYGKVTILDYDRPDLELMKADEDGSMTD